MKYYIITFFISLSTLIFAQNQAVLKEYSKEQLLSDYDLLVSSLKEAHPGLYWYTKYAEYEKIFTQNRNKIKDGMNSYEFYRIIANVVAADREGHSQVFSSEDIGDYIKKEAKFLPFAIKTINQKIYLMHDIGEIQAKGKIISKINNLPIDSILSIIFQNTSRNSDGYSKTGKFR